MINSKFGGNVSQGDIDNIMSSNAERYSLNYSHKKENRWNLWLEDSEATLSFVLNNGLFISSVSGIVKETLDKFYSSSPSDVNQWVKSDINKYIKLVKEALYKEDTRREIEGYGAYMKSYYASMKAIDDESDRIRLEQESKETDCQRYNREHDTYYTEEEYEVMFPKDEDIIYETKETVKLVKRLKPINKPSKQTPGQMTIFDFMDSE